MWALSMEQASCDLADANNFDVTYSFKKKKCTVGLPSIERRKGSSDSNQKRIKRSSHRVHKNLLLIYCKTVEFTAHIHTSPRPQDHFNIIFSNTPTTQILFLPASFQSFYNLYQAHHMPFVECTEMMIRKEIRKMKCS